MLGDEDSRMNKEIKVKEFSSGHNKFNLGLTMKNNQIQIRKSVFVSYLY